MPEEPSGRAVPNRLAGYFGTSSIRTDATTVTTRLPVRDEVRDQQGDLRMGAITYAVDLATGLAMGLAVLERDMWVVTTDIDVHLTVPVIDGPLRIEVEVLRAGATTAVSSFELHDDSTGRPVGGGTATGRPFPFDFDRSYLDVPIGSPLVHVSPDEPLVGPVASMLGLRVGEDASVEVDIDDWLRNPWGILHGGVTACIVDIAAEHAAVAALGRPARTTGSMIRYVAPGRVGPARAVPRVLGDDGTTALVEVRVSDTGADDRLLAIATMTVA
jgi:acyl-coenzyme A thioesterase PaaI-like protein